MIRERLLPTTDTANNVAIPFVVLSICPGFTVAYKDASLQIYGLDRNMYRFNGVYVNLTNNSLDDPKDIYDSITHDLDEILSSMTFYTGASDNLEIKFNKTHLYDDIEITITHGAPFGKCYGILPKANLLEQSIQAIGFVSHIDVCVYFGYPGQMMHPNTKTKVIANFRNTLNSWIMSKLFKTSKSIRFKVEFPYL